jgi:hypothetical protein
VIKEPARAPSIHNRFLLKSPAIRGEIHMKKALLGLGLTAMALAFRHYELFAEFA